MADQGFQLDRVDAASPTRHFVSDKEAGIVERFRKADLCEHAVLDPKNKRLQSSVCFVTKQAWVSSSWAC